MFYGIVKLISYFRLTLQNIKRCICFYFLCITTFGNIANNFYITTITMSIYGIIIIIFIQRKMLLGKFLKNGKELSEAQCHLNQGSNMITGKVSLDQGDTTQILKLSNREIILILLVKRSSVYH